MIESFSVSRLHQASNSIHDCWCQGVCLTIQCRDMACIAMCRFLPCPPWFGVLFIVSTTTVKSAAVSKCFASHIKFQ